MTLDTASPDLAPRDETAMLVFDWRNNKNFVSLPSHESQGQLALLLSTFSDKRGISTHFPLPE